MLEKELCFQKPIVLLILMINDAIWFYTPGLNKWIFNDIENRYQYHQHLYALKNYVFINVDGAESEKIGIPGNNIGEATYTTTSYDLVQVHETERYNLIVLQLPRLTVMEI